MFLFNVSLLKNALLYVTRFPVKNDAYSTAEDFHWNIGVNQRADIWFRLTIWIDHFVSACCTDVLRQTTTVDHFHLNQPMPPYAVSASRTVTSKQPTILISFRSHC